MKIKYMFMTLALVGVLIFTGCQKVTPSSTTTVTSSPIVTTSPPSATTAQFPMILTDDAGRSVTLKTMPQRIVSLSPSNTEIVFALGLGDQLVGDTTYCNYPEAAKTKTKVGGYSDVDIEKVVSVQPDLILADDIHEATVIPSLEKLNIPVLVLHPASLDNIFKDIVLIGGITGKSDMAKSLTADLQNRLSAITSVTDKVNGPKPRVLYVTWHDPIFTAGGDTITGELITLAGGANVAQDLSGYATMTLESVIEKNPQIIIVMSSMGDQVSLEYINSEPRLAVTDALKNKKVYGVDADLFGRTTPRTIDALEQLARIVQLDLFK
jgi:iron complex transport system substrate-binding protein